MKTIEELRKGFEDYILKSSQLKIILLKSYFDTGINRYDSEDLHEYSLGVLNGAWFMFQELNK